MNFFYNFFIGILIGFGFILPGISSGVFCVIFGIYEKLINSIINFFKDFKHNFLFLFPIFLGAILGIVFLGNIIKYLFFNYKIEASFAFIGFILGTIPSLFNKASTKKTIIFKDLLPLFFSFSFGIFLITLENRFSINLKNNYYIASNNINIFYLIFCGFIMSIGIIIPGISSTIILMLLQIYPLYINAISNFNLYFLIPLGLGVLLGSFIWLKLIRFLLNNYHEKTFYAIIGFTLGSIFVLYPGLSCSLNGFISILILCLSAFISYKLSNYKKLKQ